MTHIQLCFQKKEPHHELVTRTPVIKALIFQVKEMKAKSKQLKYSINHMFFVTSNRKQDMKRYAATVTKSKLTMGGQGGWE